MWQGSLLEVCTSLVIASLKRYLLLSVTLAYLPLILDFAVSIIFLAVSIIFFVVSIIAGADIFVVSTFVVSVDELLLPVLLQAVNETTDATATIARTFFMFVLVLIFAGQI
jgi:hypothetical protein